jgi:hypothetical protein
VVTTLRRTSTILPSLAHCILDPSMHQIDHHMFTLCRLYSFRRLVASANAAMQAPTAPPPPYKDEEMGGHPHVSKTRMNASDYDHLH